MLKKGFFFLVFFVFIPHVMFADIVKDVIKQEVKMDDRDSATNIPLLEENLENDKDKNNNFSLEGSAEGGNENNRTVASVDFQGKLLSMAGSFVSVDSYSGSAQMSIPIVVPTGRAGIQPNISLNYNSNTELGLAGVGWTLELASIQRSAKRGAPHYDNTDIFLLSQDSGTQELVYDASAGFYRSKIEGAFMKIEFLSSDNKWRVTDRKGVKYYFGQTNSSREFDPNNNAHVFKWALDKVEDVLGNYMMISYGRDQEILYIEHIYYTFHPQLNNSFARIDFLYENRPDGRRGFWRGYGAGMLKRLKEIQVFAMDQFQRKYVFDYILSPLTGRSLLSSVTQYGADGQTFLPPTTFQYQTAGAENYTVLDINGQNFSGDNLWNYRYCGGYDRGHENYGAIPPSAFDCNFGPTVTQSSGSWSNGSWSTTTAGSLYFSSTQDVGNIFWTYLYVNQPMVLNVPYTTNEGEVGFWLNENYSTNAQHTWNLQAGYNLVVLTAYHQHQSFWVNLNYALANYVNVMNSSYVSSPQIVGDFNGDGFVDRGHFNKITGTVLIKTFNGESFATEEPWITGFAINQQIFTGDFNGDGKTDIISYNKNNGQWRVALNNGFQFIDQGVWISNFGNTERQANTVDIDSDGLTDIMVYYKSGNSLYGSFRRNTGNNGFVAYGSDVNFGSSSRIPFLADFNGDGIVDFGSFDKSSGSWTIQQNTSSAVVSYATISGFGANKDMTIGDFNEDGLIDIGFYDRAIGKLVYRKNTGAGFQSVNVEIPLNFSLNHPGMSLQTVDFNGDGLNDYMLFSPEMGGINFKFSHGEAPDLLKQIDNGIGGQNIIHYSFSANYQNVFLPFSFPVVESIVSQNALGDSYSTEYHYQNGLWNAEQREFCGFGLVRLIDADGNYRETTFLQGEYDKGRISSQASYDVNGNLYDKTEHQWALVDVSAGIKRADLIETNEYHYNGGAIGQRSKKTFAYDAFGNLLMTTDYGEVDVITGEDLFNDNITDETFYHNNTQNWLLGLPKHILTRNHNNSIISQSWLFYDGSQNFEVMPTVGLLTKKEIWAGAVQSSPENPTQQYQYDDFGNILITIDALGYQTVVTYDSLYHLFPLSKENALGHQFFNEYYGVNGVPLAENGYQGLWGQLKSSQDANSQSVTQVYDVLGRIIKTIEPGDSLEWPTESFEYLFSSQYVRILNYKRIYSGQPHTMDIANFYDGLGRKIQSKSRAAEEEVFIVSHQIEYNPRGQIFKQYGPRFTNNGFDVLDAIDASSLATSYYYDPLGRLIQKVNPDGTFLNSVYENHRIITQDENGHKIVSIFDIRGRLVEKQEYLGADGRSSYYPESAYSLYASTRYFYDDKGLLIQVMDAHNNSTEIFYDVLGRKIAMDDPDMGYWEYYYDLNGNLITQMDAKNQVINFSYDALGRLSHKTDGAHLNVDYVYDDVNVPFSKGRLTEANYLTQGTTNFSYDALGRENFSSKKIEGDYYNIQRQYDRLNRLSSLEYPDQTKVFYSYNLAGQIEKISTMHMDFVPSAPQLNEAIASDQQVFLSWEERPGAFGYKIKYGIEDGVYTEEIDALDAINYNVSALQNNTTYYFVIVAYNNYGESLPSNQEVATPLSSPVGYWAFEETSGPVIDSSGHEHHGTSVNVQRGQPGIIGNAYHFDGTSYVELGESLIPTGQADTQSVSFWFKYENCPTGYCSIIGQANSADNNHLNIQLKSSTYEIWNWKKNHSQNVSAWNDGAWHHVVYIHRANDLAGNDSYYFDGQLVNTIVSTGSWAEQTTLWRIGLNSVGHHPFVGFLDEVRIYDREVTSQEVNAFYYSGNARMKNKVKNESLKNKIEHDNIRPAQNDSLIVRYVQYNARGQIIKIIYGNSVETRYFYDDLTGRLNRVYSLSLRGNAGIHFRNNSSDRRQIEDVIEDSAYTAIQDLQYYYDSVGNIITIVDNVHNVIKTFSYDALNRLVFAQREEAGLVSYQKTYAYDAIGNILQKDGISFTYGENNAGPHAVTSLSDGTVLAYDENGNMSQIVRPGEIIQYHYDTENHLKEVLKNGRRVSFYQYDGDGGRTKKTHYEFLGAEPHERKILKSGAKKLTFLTSVFKEEKFQEGVTSSEPSQSFASTTKYIGSLFENVDSQQVRHIFLGDKRIATIMNNRAQYYLTDHLGGVNLFVDEAGEIKEFIEYEPFGAFFIHEKYGNDEETAFFYFSGKRLDDETGLYYYGARYYHPLFGRFITPDSIVQDPTGNPQTLNRYAYCNNNPVNYIDPIGHSWWKKFWRNIVAPFMSFVLGVVAVFLVPSFLPLVAQYNFWTVANTVGTSAALSSVVLNNTGEGREFTQRFGQEFFDDALGMHPKAARFASSLVSHAMLASAFYMGLSSVTMSSSYLGPDYRLAENQNGEILEYGLNEGNAQPGGSTANYIRNSIVKQTDLHGNFQYLRQGMIASDIAFQDTPGVGNVFSALNIRHSASLVNLNGVLKDSAFNINLFNPLKGSFYASPWTATCHQATFRGLVASGISVAEAFQITLNHAGWSYWLTISIYGINGYYGLSGIWNSYKP